MSAPIITNLLKIWLHSVTKLYFFFLHAIIEDEEHKEKEEDLYWSYSGETCDSEKQIFCHVTWRQWKFSASIHIEHVRIAQKSA